MLPLIWPGEISWPSISPTPSIVRAIPTTLYVPSTGPLGVDPSSGGQLTPASVTFPNHVPATAPSGPCVMSIEIFWTGPTGSTVVQWPVMLCDDASVSGGP